MKEATGELNMTVITIIAIAAIGAFFYLFVWPSIRTSIATSTCKNSWSEAEACERDEFVAKEVDGKYSCECKATATP